MSTLRLEVRPLIRETRRLAALRWTEEDRERSRQRMRRARNLSLYTDEFRKRFQAAVTATNARNLELSKKVKQHLPMLELIACGDKDALALIGAAEAKTKFLGGSCDIESIIAKLEELSGVARWLKIRFDDREVSKKRLPFSEMKPGARLPVPKLQAFLVRMNEGDFTNAYKIGIKNYGNLRGDELVNKQRALRSSYIRYVKSVEKLLAIEKGENRATVEGYTLAVIEYREKT